MELRSDVELELFLAVYSEGLVENVIDYLSNEDIDPDLLYTPAIKAFLLYTCSVALRDNYENIDEIIVKILDDIGSTIDNIAKSVFPEARSAKAEMLSAFSNYKELEKTYGLNSAEKIEGRFSENVYRHGSVNTKGVLQRFINLLRENE